MYFPMNTVIAANPIIAADAKIHIVAHTNKLHVLYRSDISNAGNWFSLWVKGDVGYLSSCDQEHPNTQSHM